MTELVDIDCINSSHHEQVVELIGEEEDCYRVKCRTCGQKWLTSKKDLDLEGGSE